MTEPIEPDRLKVIEIVDDNGTIRKMTDDEATTIADALSVAGERYESENFNDFPELEADFPGLEISDGSGYCPVQINGTYKGEELYFRARGSHASLSIGVASNAEDASVYSHPHYYAEVIVSDEPYAAGWLNPQEAETAMRHLLSNLNEFDADKNDLAHDKYMKDTKAFLLEVARKRDEKESS